MSFTQLADAVTDRFLDAADIPELDKSGRMFTVMSLGVERLRHRAEDLGIAAEKMPAIEDAARREFLKGARLAESPIERMAIAALITAPWRGFMTLPPVVHDGRDDDLRPNGDLILVPQMAFIRCRIDIALVAEIGGAERVFAIECDGNAYHQNANKDRKRTAFLASWNIPTFRLSGSAIHGRLFEATDEIVAEINKLKAEA